MSGFLPDLASWALRGTGSNNANHNSNNSNDSDDAVEASVSSDNNNNHIHPPPPPLSAGEMRAHRLARMEELQRRQQIQQQQEREQVVGEEQGEAVVGGAVVQEKDDPMDVDDNTTDKDIHAAAPPQVPPKVKSQQPSINPSPLPSHAETKRLPDASSTNATFSSSPSALPHRGTALQRKKETLLKKILHVSLKEGVLASSDEGGTTTTTTTQLLDLDSAEISAQSVAEILATRLFLDPTAVTRAGGGGGDGRSSRLAYLGVSYARAAEELKSLHSSKKTADRDALIEILDELILQTVSYGVTCLREPDLFPGSCEAFEELAQLLVNASVDPTTSITFPTSGPNSSYYYKLIEEFVIQEAVNELETVVKQVADIFFQILRKIESVLDNGPPDVVSGINCSSVSSLVVVAALQSLCSHKRVALIVSHLPLFLLPAAHSPAASERIVPPAPRNAGSLLVFMRMSDPPYERRSGPGLENHTLLGAALRIGVPKTNSSLSATTIMHQSLDSIERTVSSHRLQLRNHQVAVYNWIMSLLKGGSEARDAIQMWFIDCMLVNRTADGMRPDVSKVSSKNLLMNVSVVLLKLCDPFVGDSSKLNLINPGFVMSSKDHRGVFILNGPDGVPRLGENVTEPSLSTYNPRNRFIPFCFFISARSLRYSLHAGLNYYEGISRQLSWRHSHLPEGSDIRNDAEFGYIFAIQKSFEVAVLEPDFVTTACRFENFVAEVFCSYSDDVLKTMPEDLVDDICEILMSVCNFKAKLLAGLSFRHVFHLMVKLLSPTYARMVRNYNLRAKIGDVLYELFLPPALGDRRDTPTTVYTDVLAGGQSYMLSDPDAQKTLAPSLLLLYGEVEHTGFYDKMAHRFKIASLIKYLWESTQHRPAFARITSDKDSFVKFANGIMNETNTLIATVMQKLPEIREIQERMKNVEDWGHLTEEQQKEIEERLSDAQRDVKSSLPLCNRTIQMLSYLNTDSSIRQLFLLDELCPRLVQLLVHVLRRLVGSKGLNLKVDNPEQYEFRPKEMLRDLCAIFSLFANSRVFAEECARNECDPNLLRDAIKTVKRLNLLVACDSLTAFESLPDQVESSRLLVVRDEELYADAPDEYLDELMATYMKDPVRLPSGHIVDRSTITQHLLNDTTDPFNRAQMTLNDIIPAVELKAQMDLWLEKKRQLRSGNAPTTSTK